jgi:uncharacterized protein (DUF305 family)
MRTRRGALLIAVLLMLSAGCGGNPAPAGESAPRPAGAPVPVAGVDFNAADVMFLQMMVNHHNQGLEIVRMSNGRNVRPDVATLAAAIAVTQSDEVASMQQWLGSWGKPPTADPADHAHAAHGGMPMTSEAQLAALRSADEPAFERTFLNVLVAHQHNAIEMAKSAAEQGINPDARDLADRIVRSRSAQIAQMLGYLSAAPS